MYPSYPWGQFFDSAIRLIAFSGGQVYAVGRCRSPKWEIQTQLRKENFHETPGPEAWSPVFACWYRCLCGFSGRPLSYLSQLSAPGPPLRRVLFLQLQPIVLIEMSGPRLHSARQWRVMCWCGQSDLNRLLIKGNSASGCPGSPPCLSCLGFGHRYAWKISSRY